MTWVAVDPVRVTPLTVTYMSDKYKTSSSYVFQMTGEWPMSQDGGVTTDPPARPERHLHLTLLDDLGQRITGGDLPAGTAISAVDVAAEYGVSRSVVREATRVLESLGLVSVRRKVGTTVLPESRWNVLDPNVIRWRVAGPGRVDQLGSLAELRTGVEPLAARLAARRASTAQVAVLATSVAQMVAHAAEADGGAYLEADITFHTTVLAASGNPMLRALAPLVGEVLRGRTKHALMPTDADRTALQLHGDVARAVGLGDAEAAETAMRAIIDEADEAVRQIAEHETEDAGAISRRRSASGSASTRSAHPR